MGYFDLGGVGHKMGDLPLIVLQRLPSHLTNQTPMRVCVCVRVSV